MRADFLEGLRRDLTATPPAVRKRRGRVFASQGPYIDYLKVAKSKELIGFMKACDVRAINDLFLWKNGEGHTAKIIDGRQSNGGAVALM